MPNVATLHTDFNAPCLRLQTEALRAIDSAALALGAIAAALERPSEFRGARRFLAVGLPDRPLDDAKNDAMAAVLTSTFRELTAGVETFLDSIRELCAVCDHFRENETSSGEAVTGLLVGDDAKRFIGDQLTKKLDLLKQRYAIDAATRGEIVSLQKARNCLAHRRGVVGQKDCGSGTTLEVGWFRPELAVRSPDGTVQPIDGEMIFEEGAHVVMMIQKRERRSFTLGSRIVFDIDDLIGFWWTVQRFATETSLGAVAFAESTGVVFVTAPPSPESA